MAAGHSSAPLPRGSNAQGGQHHGDELVQYPHFTDEETEGKLTVQSGSSTAGGDRHIQLLLQGGQLVLCPGLALETMSPFLLLSCHSLVSALRQQGATFREEVGCRPQPLVDVKTERSTKEPKAWVYYKNSPQKCSQVFEESVSGDSHNPRLLESTKLHLTGLYAHPFSIHIQTTQRSTSLLS